MKKDIYIIKNSVNHKVYIGQAKNAAERWLSHIYNAKYEAKNHKDKQLLHKAMNKYGVDKFHYEILEYQISNYDEREQYWIREYKSIAPNGYNVLSGGSGNGTGIESAGAIFKDNQTLMKCISEISASGKSFVNIATKYRCSPEVISAINNGYRYRQDDLVYPLRDTTQAYGNEIVKQIRYSIKYELDLTLKEIAEKYDVDLSQVSLINQGKKYYLANETYPLRQKRITDISGEVLAMIISDILNSQMCLSDIASKYNMSRSRISCINRGVFYKSDSLNYPLRDDDDPRNKSLKKFLDRETIIEIQSQLRGSMSISDIAKKHGVSNTTIQNINNGVCKKYHIGGVKYPIRK